jgi:hypothetical protein
MKNRRTHARRSLRKKARLTRRKRQYGGTSYPELNNCIKATVLEGGERVKLTGRYIPTGNGYYKAGLLHGNTIYEIVGDIQRINEPCGEPYTAQRMYRDNRYAVLPRA